MNAKSNDEPQVATLRLQRGKRVDGDWHDTSATKQGTVLETYSYCFLGGKKGRGHFSSVADGNAQTYTVTLKEDGPGKEYWIKDIGFSSNVLDQLKSQPGKGSQPDTYTITNKNTEVMQAYYVVKVERSDGAIIDCDPMISNEPRG